MAVTSVMYLKTIGVKIPAVVANLITTLQLGQMIIGLFVNLLSMYYYGKFITFYASLLHGFFNGFKSVRFDVYRVWCGLLSISNFN